MLVKHEDKNNQCNQKLHNKNHLLILSYQSTLILGMLHIMTPYDFWCHDIKKISRASACYPSSIVKHNLGVNFQILTGLWLTGDQWNYHTTSVPTVFTFVQIQC